MRGTVDFTLHFLQGMWEHLMENEPLCGLTALSSGKFRFELVCIRATEFKSEIIQFWIFQLFICEEAEQELIFLNPSSPGSPLIYFKFLFFF